MDNGARSRARACSILVLLGIVGIAMAAGAVPALVRTNVGAVLQGGLSGLAPTLRLSDPSSLIGPATQYDIPLSSILQIFVDFPRFVVETEDRVYIGPYSAFSGIAQKLEISDRGAGGSFFATTLSAIALNGQPFRPLPREWLGRQWLGQGIRVITKPLRTTTAAPPTTQPATSTPSAPADEVIWGELTPTETPAEETNGLPWWVGVIAVGVILGLLLLSSSGSS
ncbi:MAG: hypothetical protein PHV11_09210 [Candidatus Bipolaricaulis sp.]|nr:hypothetical protein [Candidatus Bipolaricaulis sp.]